MQRTSFTRRVNSLSLASSKFIIHLFSTIICRNTTGGSICFCWIFKRIYKYWLAFTQLQGTSNRYNNWPLRINFEIWQNYTFIKDLVKWSLKIIIIRFIWIYCSFCNFCKSQRISFGNQQNLLSWRVKIKRPYLYTLQTTRDFTTTRIKLVLVPISSLPYSAAFVQWGSHYTVELVLVLSVLLGPSRLQLWSFTRHVKDLVIRTFQV